MKILGSRAHLVALVAIVAAGAVLRALAARGDLWLDEIWSWDLVAGGATAWQVLVAEHSEANHHLNTLWFLVLGPDASEIQYRLLSLCEGVAAVVVAALVARRAGRTEALIAAGLIAFSYPLVHYASEARGYSGAVLFALTALLLFVRLLQVRRVRDEVGFGAACILGLLSHLTFVHAYAGFLAGSVVDVAMRRGDRLSALVGALRLHAIPATFLAAMYQVHIRRMRNEGGDVLPLGATLLETLSYTAGGPPDGVLAAGAAVVAGLALAGGLAVLVRQRSPAAAVYVTGIVLAPAALLLGLSRAEIYPRYFLVPAALLLVVASHALAAAWRSHALGRALAVVTLVAFVAGNAVNLADLLRYGRGGYSAALRDMAELASGPDVVFATDHVFRGNMVASYYSVALPDDKRLILRGTDAHFRDPAEFVVLHARGRGWRPEPTKTDLSYARFELVGTYRSAPLSGFHWSVYRRVDP